MPLIYKQFVPFALQLGNTMPKPVHFSAKGIDGVPKLLIEFVDLQSRELSSRASFSREDVGFLERVAGCADVVDADSHWRHSLLHSRMVVVCSHTKQNLSSGSALNREGSDIAILRIHSPNNRSNPIPIARDTVHVDDALLDLLHAHRRVH